MKTRKIILFIFLFFSLFFYSVDMVFAMSGSAVFKTRCIGCHTINGAGGNAGPNLSNIGLKKSSVWIKDFIKSPNSYFSPGSSVSINGKEYIVMMPSFKNMLSKNRLNAVSSYLESLK